MSGGWRVRMQYRTAALNQSKINFGNPENSTKIVFLINLTYLIQLKML